MYKQVGEKITVKQASKLLAVKPDTIYHHLEQGHYNRVDNAGHIDSRSFVEYLQSNYQRYSVLANRYKNLYERIVIR